MGSWLNSAPLEGVRMWLKNLKYGDRGFKIFMLKGFLLGAFVAAAIVTTVTTRNKMKDAESGLFHARFNAVSEIASRDIIGNLNSLDFAVNSLAFSYGDVHPDADTWPNAAWPRFTAATSLLSKQTPAQALFMLPLVTPDKADSYAKYITDFYDADADRNKELYFPPFFPNGTIWKISNTGMPVPDITGNNSGSANLILTPVAQYTTSDLVFPHLANYNLHSVPYYSMTIDAVIKCAEEHNYTYATFNCGALSFSDPVYTLNDQSEYAVTDMAAAFFHPIFPAHNVSQMVGFTAGTFSWKTLLAKVLSPEVDSVEVVVTYKGGAFTFRVDNGVPILLGQADLHDSEYDDMVKRAHIEHNTAAGESGHVISIYPTKEFQDEFETHKPFFTALSMLAIFVFCAVLFGLYDGLMRRAFDRNQAVLDTKRRFVRFISHEIRTPLNTVCLGMKLLEVEMGKFANSVAGAPQGSLGARTLAALDSWKHLADEVVESSETAVEVLNDLLNYDKIELGTLKLDLSCVDIGAVVKRVTSAMQVQAQQKGITLTLTDKSASRPSDADVVAYEDEFGSGGERILIGDAYRMGQVLRNLVSNALKFTPPEGHVTVSVKVVAANRSVPEEVKSASAEYESLRQAGTVIIAVKDTGAGLTPKQLEEICAEGVQFNANELQAGQGSGLGLFISKGIVEQHGGRMSVASDGLGQGVTFTVELPLFRSDFSKRVERLDTCNENEVTDIRTTRCDTSSRSMLTTGLVVDTRRTASQRILVVDDSVCNRKMVVRLLRAQDHLCEEVEDGEVALKKYSEMVARGEPPDAILMDFEMPVMNGPTATTRLREMGCNCLIVGVTGNVLPADKAAFRSAGADAVLAKPLVLEDLTRVLATARNVFRKPTPLSVTNTRRPQSGKVYLMSEIV